MLSYGTEYDQGTTISAYSIETPDLIQLKEEILLYNFMIETKKDLLCKKIVISKNYGIGYEGPEYEIENVVDFHLPEELLGYLFYATLFYGKSTEKYLLCGRSREEPNEKKIYTDILIIDQDNSQLVNILQSYASEYNPSSVDLLENNEQILYDLAWDIFPEPFIPMGITFTMKIVDNYAVYRDVDSLWKVQDVRSGEIYTSEEDNPSKDWNLFMGHNFEEVAEQYYRAVGEYIYILKYSSDDSILAFDTNNKDFVILPSEIM